VAKPQSYRDLIVWNRAMDLVEEVYRLTATFPARERWRLVDQVSRAVVSVPANIAEGQGRATTKDFGNFLAIAKGSLNEVETYLHLAARPGYLDEPAVTPAFGLATEVSKMLTSLRRRVLTGDA
jgi:four helix bundle protein